jgi:hypothetical protein
MGMKPIPHSRQLGEKNPIFLLELSDLGSRVRAHEDQDHEEEHLLQRERSPAVGTRGPESGALVLGLGAPGAPESCDQMKNYLLTLTKGDDVVWATIVTRHWLVLAADEGKAILHYVLGDGRECDYPVNEDERVSVRLGSPADWFNEPIK